MSDTLSFFLLKLFRKLLRSRSILNQQRLTKHKKNKLRKPKIPIFGILLCFKDNNSRSFNSLYYKIKNIFRLKSSINKRPLGRVAAGSVARKYEQKLKKWPNFRKPLKIYIKALVKIQNIYIKGLSKGKNIYIKAQREGAKTSF